MATTGKSAHAVACVIALAAMSGTAQAGKCMRVAGQGTAITNELAGVNAKMAVAEAIANAGAKARGGVAVKCKYEFIVSTCTASQRACK